MKKATKTFLSICFACAMATGAVADQVVLKNGDRLTGEVVRKTEGNLVFKTKYAGEVTIDWAEVLKLETDAAVRLELGDGGQKVGKLGFEGVETVVEDDGGMKKIALEQIAAINPPEKPHLKISGQLNFGLTQDRGNTDEDVLHVDGETTFRWPDDRLRFAFNGDFEKNDGERTKQEVDFLTLYDHFIDEKWFWANGLKLEHDDFADLNLRTTITSGVGYQFYETEQTELSVQGGPGYLWEDFDEANDQDYIVGLWALRFSHLIWPEWKLRAFHNHNFTQSLEDTDDFIFESSTGVRVPLFGNFQTTFQFDYDHDNAPGEDADKDDYTYRLTAGYVW